MVLPENLVEHHRHGIVMGTRKCVRSPAVVHVATLSEAFLLRRT